MSVQFKDRRPGASIRSLKDIVPEASATDHVDWIEFLQSNDGAVPEPNVFDVGSDNAAGVQAFYSVAEVRAERREVSDRMAEHLVPIADAEGGNYVCLGLAPSSSGVHFWDHETEETTLLSSSFAQFLADLRPFDPASVKLKPGQVVSVWVDPALLEAEKKRGNTR